MISIKNSGIAIRVKNGHITKEELTEYLLKTYSVFDLAESVADILFKDASDAFDSIPISEEQFLRHFKIVGKRMTSAGDFIEERRGRKKGTRVIDGRVVLAEDNVEGFFPEEN